MGAHFPTLDILVNNAGATWGMPLDDFSEHASDKVMDTNVKGVFFLTQRLLPNLRAGATADDLAAVTAFAARAAASISARLAPGRPKPIFSARLAPKRSVS